MAFQARDLILYALADPAAARGDLAAMTRAAVDGGATLVQLRDKTGGVRETIEHARAIKHALAGTGVKLLVNDRVDVALAAGADGVHLGQDDMPAEMARALLGPEAVIGLTVRSAEEIAAAPLDAIDYVGIGGVYATTSKEKTRGPIGLDGFAALVALMRRRKAGFPVAGIAGINADNAGEVIHAGADGVAVIAALFAGPDPKQAARALRETVDAAYAGSVGA